MKIPIKSYKIPWKSHSNPPSNTSHSWPGLITRAPICPTFPATLITAVVLEIIGKNHQLVTGVAQIAGWMMDYCILFDIIYPNMIKFIQLLIEWFPSMGDFTTNYSEYPNPWNGWWNGGYPHWWKPPRRLSPSSKQRRFRSTVPCVNIDRDTLCWCRKPPPVLWKSSVNEENVKMHPEFQFLCIISYSISWQHVLIKYGYQLPSSKRGPCQIRAWKIFIC